MSSELEKQSPPAAAGASAEAAPQPAPVTGPSAPVDVGAETQVPVSRSGEVAAAGSADPETPLYQSAEFLDDEQDDLIGAVLADRYRVLSVLGVGGMGTVYLAEHVTIEKKLAVKVLLPEYSRRADIRERFLQEARAATKIAHPNIVDITDFGTLPRGSAFFAMEYLEGANLGELINFRGGLSWPRTRRIMLQICQALQAAHNKGIIHRDMKPENIVLVDRGGRNDFIKVLDFGIAKMDLGGDGPRLTQTGMVLGTPEYMSPEQAQGKSLDHRVDVYAVGVILYEMLTGKVPFKADTFMGTLTQHIFQEPTPPRQMAPEAGIAPEVEALTLQAIAKDPDQRFASMDEFARAIDAIPDDVSAGDPADDDAAAAEGPAHSPQTSTATSSQDYFATVEVTDETAAVQPPARRGRTLIAAAAVLLLLAGGVVAVLATTGDGPGADETLLSAAGSGGQAAGGTVEAPPPVPAVNAISVESTPPGATILRGDEELGKTPRSIDLPAGADAVTLRLELSGYQPQTLDVVPDRPRSYMLQLLPVAADAAPAPADLGAPDAAPAVASKPKAQRRKGHGRRRPGRHGRKPKKPGKDKAGDKDQPKPASKQLDKLINPFE